MPVTARGEVNRKTPTAFACEAKASNRRPAGGAAVVRSARSHVSARRRHSLRAGANSRQPRPREPRDPALPPRAATGSESSARLRKLPVSRELLPKYRQARGGAALLAQG